MGFEMINCGTIMDIRWPNGRIENFGCVFKYLVSNRVFAQPNFGSNFGPKNSQIRFLDRNLNCPKFEFQRNLPYGLISLIIDLVLDINHIL